MKRHESPEWKALVRAQNRLACNGGMVDILTITGFMNEDQFMQHVARYVTDSDRRG